MTAFAELGLNAKLVKNIAAKGYDSPSPIQAKAIPLVLSGCDLMAAAQIRHGQVEQPVFVLEDQPLTFFPYMPMLSIGDHRRAVFRCLGLDHIQNFVMLGSDD